MAKVNCLRDFVNERLTVAAEEIVKFFEKTIFDYEKEINHQRVLLAAVCKPQVKLHRTVVPEQFFHVNERQTELQACIQKKKSGLDQQDSKFLEVKEENVDLSTSLDKEHNQETDSTFLAVKSEKSTAETFSTNPVKSTDKESIDSILVQSCEILNAGLKDSCLPETDQAGIKADNLEPTEKRRSRREKRTPLFLHAGKKCEFRCETCGKAFPFKSKLIRHQRIHTGVKPYCCSVCGKRFNQTSILKVHLRIHTGERPYSCDVCWKTFNQKSILNVHKKTHSLERPYACDVCGKRFFQKASMEAHVIWHTELAPSFLKEEDVFHDQQLFNQQKRSSLSQSDSQSLQIKEEQEDLCVSQHDLQQDPDALVLSLSCGNSYHSGAETLYLHPGELQSSGKSLDESDHRADGQKHQFKTPFTAFEAEKQEYKCETCGKAFQFRSRLLRHMIIHTGVKPFSCHVCGKRFNQKSILIVHQRIHTGERPYSCDVCGKRFNQKSILNGHKKTHSLERPYACDVCGKRFFQKASMEAHVIWHTELAPSFLKEEDVFHDQQLFNQQKRSSLSQSDSQSLQIKEEQEDLCVSQHDLQQDPDALVLSLSCGNSYHSGAETLYLHPGELQSSGKSLDESDHRADGQKHQFKTPFTAFEPEKQEYKCETCGKVFQFQSRLLRHMIIHTGVKPFSCHVCGKRFNQKSILIVHQRIHTGERPYSCDVCGKRFNQKSILNVHKRIHTGERPYCCETCGKTFTQKSILNGHKIIHTSERPYSCKACGKSLRSHSSLSVHMKTHAGEPQNANKTC